MSKGLKHITGISVDLNELLLQGRDLRHEVHAALALLLLELEGDITDGTTGDPLHEVGGESRDLVAHALGGDDGDLVADPLVGVEVKGETSVVLLNDDTSRALDSLGTNSHCLFILEVEWGRDREVLERAGWGGVL